MKLIFEETENIRDSAYFDNVVYDRLTEANLNRISRGHDTSDGYIIISAGRDMRNLVNEMTEKEMKDNRLTTDDIDRWEDEVSSGKISDKTVEQVARVNNRRTSDLARELTSLHYPYVAAFGGYKEDGTEEFSFEKSFVVYPYNYDKNASKDDVKNQKVSFDKFVDDMIDLGNEYHQDSILVKEPNEKAKYVNCETGSTEIEFSGVTLNDISKQYFTALKKYHPSMKYGKPQRFTYEGLYAPVGGSIMDCHRRYSSGQLFFNPYDKN